MKRASITDRKKVVSILQKSFKNNPSLLFMTRDSQKKKHIKRVLKFAFDFAIRRKAVFLSPSEKGVAICYKNYEGKKDIRDLYNELKMVLNAFPFWKLPKIWKHCKYIQKNRPQNKPYLYVWFYGVDPDEEPKTSARALKNSLFKKARKEQLDLYAETTLLRNKIIYERFGFEVYKEWYNAACDLQVWFMRRSYMKQEIL